MKQQKEIIGSCTLYNGDCLELLPSLKGIDADMFFADPPYGMKKRNIVNDNLNFYDLLEFNRNWILPSFDTLKVNGSWYCWGMDEPLMDIYNNILKPLSEEKKITFRNLITWKKARGHGQNSSKLLKYSIADEKCLFVMCGFLNYSERYLDIWDNIRNYMIEQKDVAQLKSVKQINNILGVDESGGGMASHYFSKTAKQYIFPTESAYKKLQNYCIKNNLNAFELDYNVLKKNFEEIKNKFYSTRPYFNNTHDNMNNVWSFGIPSIKERKETDGHPAQKPIALCSRAIKTSCSPSGTVIDPFMGSGSVGVACALLGRNYIGIEINKKSFDISCKRIEEAYKQIELFKEAS